MNLIDPNKDLFCGVLSKKHCIKTKKGLYIKDLRIINNKDLNDILLVDKSVQSFAFQIDNGIPLLPWKGDSSDCELSFLADYLIYLVQFENLREANKNSLRLSEIAKLFKNF